MMLNGIDVSSWQGVMNWEKALQAGVQFAFIRAGMGNDIRDLQAARNAAECRRLGIPYGLYWFVKPGKDWRKHADSFTAAVQELGCPMAPVFDVEENGGLSKVELESWLVKCYNRLIDALDLDYYDNLITYTSPGFLNASLGLTNWLKLTKLWVAHWTTATGPIIPNEWGAIANPRTWAFWQWSADKNGRGAEFGAQSADIDLDRFNGDAGTFEAIFKVKPASVPGTPAPTPSLPPTPGYPARVRVIAASGVMVNLRAAPWGTVTAKTWRGCEFEVMGVQNVEGRDWYQLGPSVWVASWLTVSLS